MSLEFFDKNVFFQDSWPNTGTYIDKHYKAASDLYYLYIKEKDTLSPFTVPGSGSSYQLPDSNSKHIVYPTVSGSNISASDELKFRDSLLNNLTTCKSFYLGARYGLRYNTGVSAVPEIQIGNTIIIHPRDIANALINNKETHLLGVFAGYQSIYFTKAIYKACMNAGKKFLFLFTPQFASNVRSTDFSDLIDQQNLKTIFIQDLVNPDQFQPDTMLTQDFALDFCNKLGSREFDNRKSKFEVLTPTNAKDRIAYLLRYEQVFSMFNYISSAETIPQ
jgi:hypothetical protein